MTKQQTPLSIKKSAPTGTNNKELLSPGLVQRDAHKCVEEDIPVSNGSSAYITASVFPTHDSIISQFLDAIQCSFSRILFSFLLSRRI